MVELAEDSGAGIVVEDAVALAEALEAWAADPASLERRRASAREWAAANLYGPSAYDDLAAAVARLAGRDAT